RRRLGGRGAPVGCGREDFAHLHRRRGFARVSGWAEAAGRGGAEQPMTAARQRGMAGNWKMHKTQTGARAVFAAVLPPGAEEAKADIVMAPAFTSLAAAVECTRGSRVAIGAQDTHWNKEGAFTGEISVGMLAEVGCRYVIVGHSERRQYCGETDDIVAQKS